MQRSSAILRGPTQPFALLPLPPEAPLRLGVVVCCHSGLCICVDFCIPAPPQIRPCGGRRSGGRMCTLTPRQRQRALRDGHSPTMARLDVLCLRYHRDHPSRTPARFHGRTLQVPREGGGGRRGGRRLVSSKAVSRAVPRRNSTTAPRGCKKAGAGAAKGHPVSLRAFAFIALKMLLQPADHVEMPHAAGPPAYCHLRRWVRPVPFFVVHLPRVPASFRSPRFGGGGGGGIMAHCHPVRREIPMPEERGEVNAGALQLTESRLSRIDKVPEQFSTPGCRTVGTASRQAPPVLLAGRRKAW
ncbi:hypothetical protein BT67DRAFT_125941 [Trichocladium antarcticum]|uniref:Uncharacterized protein n=1 Tax=Trichocladium antarcticum TaxID=1450529 RepID=A0AAN6ZG54_9PEZI|nr:hypothetical protein BT67DRAFT_125941 [Trichocladium antarcticum]